MITHAAFKNLRPDARRQRILEGIEHVNAQYAELAVITKKLNAWLDSIDIDHADKKQVDRFRNLTDDCQYNADLLTEQILIASQKVRHIKDYISKQLIQNIQTPMSNDLFITAQDAVQRVESILHLALTTYQLAFCKDKTGSGIVVYHAAMTFTRRDGSHGYITAKGESFPELMMNIANNPELVKL